MQTLNTFIFIILGALALGGVYRMAHGSMPLTFHWAQRLWRGYSDTDEYRVHARMVHARDNQAPFNMNKWELNALRASTVHHPNFDQENMGDESHKQ